MTTLPQRRGVSFNRSGELQFCYPLCTMKLSSTTAPRHQTKAQTTYKRHVSDRRAQKIARVVCPSLCLSAVCQAIEQTELASEGAIAKGRCPAFQSPATTSSGGPSRRLGSDKGQQNEVPTAPGGDIQTQQSGSSYDSLGGVVVPLFLPASSMRGRA